MYAFIHELTWMSDHDWSLLLEFIYVETTVCKDHDIL